MERIKVDFRLYPAEKEFIKEKASKEHRTISAYIRDQLYKTADGKEMKKILKKIEGRG